MANSTALLHVEPVTTAVGAIVDGVDLTKPLERDTVRAIRSAVLDHGVVFFRGQELSRAEFLAFMTNFGTPCMDPFSVGADRAVPPEETIVEMVTLGYSRATAVWHYDSSLAAQPASLMALRAVELPPVGGDTCWSSMYAAYDALSESLRNFLDGLTAEHSAYKVLSLMGGGPFDFLQEGMRNVHPVVRVHPETGRKALFVNELWTERIVELQADESSHLLSFLFEHVKAPLFAVRWRWQPNDVALSDNRAFQHYAVNDYDAPRVMQKALLAGDRPIGP